MSVGSAPRAALVVGHPGHELRVHGWLERARPTVFVLSDGSGGAGAARTASSAALVARAGAGPGAIFGRHTDRELYRALLRHDQRLFLALADDLTAALEAAGAECVVADARDGYNPMHDVCRLLADHAVSRLRRAGRRVESLCFAPVDGAGHPPAAGGEVFELALDDPALERKLAAARGYAGLEGEVAAALRGAGVEALRRERLWPAPHPLPPGPAKPYYETYGEQRVAGGHYQAVLRYAEHVRPLEEALERAGA